MTREKTRQRLTALERQRGEGVKPLVIVLSLVEADGSRADCDRIVSEYTGDEWHRQPGESMDVFIERAETAATGLSRLHRRPLLIVCRE